MPWGARRAAVQIAGRGREGLKEGLQRLNNRRLATDHQTETALESPDAAACAHVDEMHLRPGEMMCPGDTVVVVRIAAVDDGVPRRKERP